MDSGEFDDLIKNSLDGFSQLPEKEVKKAIFGKLFYQNLWVFHKVKLMASVVMIGGGSFLINHYLNSNNIIENNQSNSIENLNQKLVENTVEPVTSKVDDKQKTDESGNLDNVQRIEDENNNPELNAITNVIADASNSDNSKAKNENLNIDKQKNVLDADQYNEDSNALISNTKIAEASDKNDADAIVEVNQLNPEADDEILSSNESKSTQINNIEKVVIDDKVNTLNIVALHSCYPVNEIKDVSTPDFSDYANEHKRGFTFDAYFSPLNRADVDNVLDPVHNNYWWDFYKEHDMERSGLGGGLNVSYNYRNFKLNSGFNFDQIYDYKPHYEYFTDHDSIYAIQNGNIVLLNVELISGLQVFGPADSSGLTPVVNTDTTVVFYVDPNNENLSHEIEQNANRYNYLRIPLTLGYEFSLKRASFEVNAGVEYTRLMRANGISYKDGYVDVGIRTVPYYYYEDMVATTFQNNMSSIKVNNWNYVASAIVRVRMTRSLDFFSSFRFQYNTNNIMSDSYVLQKTYKKYGINVGVTYHLNKRMSLKEMVTPSWD